MEPWRISDALLFQTKTHLPWLICKLTNLLLAILNSCYLKQFLVSLAFDIQSKLL